MPDERKPAPETLAGEADGGTGGRVLVVDDEESMRHFLVKGLKRRGHDVHAAASADEAMSALADGEWDLVLLDLKMPGKSGMDVLPQILAIRGGPRVIVMTGYATVETAVEAMKAGASDYVTKPLSLPDIVQRCAREIRVSMIEKQNARLKDVVSRRASSALLGASRQMRDLRAEIEKIAPGNSTVLLLGESGTGKELAARAIHEAGHRSGGPFVPVNCGGLPGTLLESELFGYHAGAFTGAVRRKTGLLEKASGGTLFLDEIGELSTQFQVALLRALQEREITPLGGTDPVKVDFRLVAATHRDLESEMMAGRFREDLYYRINVISIRLPPLRERSGDVPLLARHFLSVHSGPGSDFTPEALEALLNWHWPGNVRELMNVVESCAALGARGMIGLDALPANVRKRSAPCAEPPPMRDARLVFEKGYVEDLLRSAGGNLSKAARIAGVSRPSLHAKVKELGLDPSAFKPGEN